MEERYNFHKIETKWQKTWCEKGQEGLTVADMPADLAELRVQICEDVGHRFRRRFHALTGLADYCSCREQVCPQVIGDPPSAKEAAAAYGLDTVRLFLLFATPPTRPVVWNDQRVEGMYRFLNRVWRLIYRSLPFIAPESIPFIQPDGENQKMAAETGRVIKRVTSELTGRGHLNAAVGVLMEFTKVLTGYRKLPVEQQHPVVLRDALETMVSLLAPFAPHITAELWMGLGHEESIHDRPWPSVAEGKNHRQTVEIAVQIDGKARGRITVPTDWPVNRVEEFALLQPQIAKRLTGKRIVKVIAAQHKFVNIVTQ